MKITLKEIGKVRAGRSFAVELAPGYASGLTGLKGFSHVLIVWYADKSPAWDDSALLIDKPYRKAPDRLGVFATRTPVRPNPICVSVAAVSSIDEKKGLVKLWWTDALDGTPVLDLKPYHPCSDLVKKTTCPPWCAHWPDSYEGSAKFDWESEFTFGNGEEAQ